MQRFLGNYWPMPVGMIIFAFAITLISEVPLGYISFPIAALLLGFNLGLEVLPYLAKFAKKVINHGSIFLIGMDNLILFLIIEIAFVIAMIFVFVVGLAIFGFFNFLEHNIFAKCVVGLFAFAVVLLVLLTTRLQLQRIKESWRS